MQSVLCQTSSGLLSRVELFEMAWSQIRARPRTSLRGCEVDVDGCRGIIGRYAPTKICFDSRSLLPCIATVLIMKALDKN